MADYEKKDECNDTNIGRIRMTNINLEKFSDLMHIGWKAVHVSHEMDISEWSDSRLKQSTYVYQNPNNLNEGMRIYEDYADYKYTFHRDDKLIEELQKKQPNIKLTQFPTGVITIEGKVIGQIIPYYYGYKKISEVVKSGISEEQFYDYLKKIIDIFKELLDNNIYYSDIHGGNIMINQENDDVKLIDFENPFIDILCRKDLQDKYCYDVVYRLAAFFNTLGESLGIKLIDNIKDIKTFEDLYNVIPEKGKSLIKR